MVENPDISVEAPTELIAEEARGPRPREDARLDELARANETNTDKISWRIILYTILKC